VHPVGSYCTNCVKFRWKFYCGVFGYSVI